MWWWWWWWGGVIAGATSPESRSGDPTTNAPGQEVAQGQCCVVLPSFWCGNRFNGLRRGSASVTTRWIVACASVVRERGCGGGCGVSPRDLPEPGRWWLAHCQVHRGTTGASPPRIRWKLPAHHPVHTHQNQTPAASAAPRSLASRRRAQAHTTHDAAISRYSTLPHARTVAPGAVAGAHATTTRNAVARPWEHARPVRTWRVWWCSAYKTASHARTPGTAGYNETRAWGRRRPQQLAQRGYGCGGYYGPHTTKPLRGNPVWPCTAVQVHSGGGRGRVWWKSTARKPPRGSNMTYT